MCARSSVGRALDSDSRGHGFKSRRVHQSKKRSHVFGDLFYFSVRKQGISSLILHVDYMLVFSASRILHGRFVRKRYGYFIYTLSPEIISES